MNSVRDSVLRDLTTPGVVRVTAKLSWTELQAKVYQLEEYERHLARACEQIILLNDFIGKLTKRYETSKIQNFRSFRYNLRVRISVFEGVRNVFYEYCRDVAEDIADLRGELFGQNVEIITDSDDNDDDTDDELSQSYDDYENEDSDLLSEEDDGGSYVESDNYNDGYDETYDDEA